MGVDPFSYSHKSFDLQHFHGLQTNAKVMESIPFSRAIIIGIAFLLAATFSIFLSTSQSPVLIEKHASIGNDENEFVFAGTCHNGETYRLLSYNKVVDGQTLSFYDYEGPAGKGSVRTQATPRTMSVRVCRKLAEIINDH
jgi:hypothetical protein